MIVSSLLMICRVGILLTVCWESPKDFHRRLTLACFSHTANGRGFDPDCPQCQDETAALDNAKESIALMKAKPKIFTADDDLPEIEELKFLNECEDFINALPEIRVVNRSFGGIGAAMLRKLQHMRN